MNSVIAVLEKFNIGLIRDGSVVLVPHNPHWSEAANYEIKRLSTKVGGPAFSFHHIGSTSIPDICAKPILDILVLGPTLKAIDKFQKTFQDLGYEYKGEYGIPGRRYCVLYNEKKTKGFVHVHAFEAGSREAQNHLLFRDYLRANPETVKKYQQLKIQLQTDQQNKRSKYTENKAPFIQDVLRAAVMWQSGR